MHRPRTVLTATIAHGWCTSVFVADSRVNHGACAFIEILCQTLDHVLQVATSRGRRFPSRLVIQSDNTVAQAKNAVVMLCLAYLVALGYFVSVDIMFLMVGHTHEDVDQPLLSCVNTWVADEISRSPWM